jgi:hypothetical protein
MFDSDMAVYLNENNNSRFWRYWALCWRHLPLRCVKS